MVFFDLPVKTKPERKAAATFRRFLLNDGYFMVQYSLYTRVCNGPDSVETHRNRINMHLPANGSVRLMVVTEKQYESMYVLVGPRRKEEEVEPGEQLSIF